ncbi:MAG: hypothetical protein H6611_01410 [Ignavibacteriales bacterium]|nr:hypothetical protein [Ignavibacteriales bacterium]
MQDYNNILAASGNVENLEAIEESEFLLNSLNDSTFAWRILDSDTLQIFEAVHPFSHNGRLVGLFRLGLSLDPLNAINERIIRRLIIIGIILFVLGSLLLTYIFTQQNFDVLQKRFKIVEAYSDKVLHNVSDAVIVIDENNVIKISNNAANKLLNLNANSLDNKIETLNLDHSCFRIFNTNLGLEQIECNIQNDRKYLLISKSTFETENKSTNTVLVIRDLTEQKLLENQIQRKERMVAMGELASGVAHEIRNPLNTISTITQQLNKDFEPIENKEEFKTLSNLVANEVKRINQTVQSFLRFTKPEKISPSEFLLSELITQIENQYKLMLKEKSITFSHKLNWDGIVKWDRNQIQQVIMNLVQNSFDSIENKGEIYIESFKQNEDIIIKIKDNGPGIPSHILNKIFNLYFTTKAKGTGIGLSIVQKIIMEHGGIINVESEENNGTEFSIKLPIIYNS